MGRLAKILSFMRVTRHDTPATDVKSDPGGGNNITPQHVAPPGDDSHPLPGDYVAILDVTPSRSVAVGYVDPTNTPLTEEGEKRIYSRAAGSGETVAQTYLKNDGTVITSNDLGSITLLPDGGAIIISPAATFVVGAGGSIKGFNEDGVFEMLSSGVFTVNGVTIDTGGNITSPARIKGQTVEGIASNIAAGKELVNHIHGGVDTGSGQTSPNL